MRKPTPTARLVAPGQLGLAGALVLAVVVSSIGVIYSTYLSRQLFNETQRLQRGEWSLEEERERLLLEQSTWASHERVSDIAASKLDMVSPDPVTIKVVP